VVVSATEGGYINTKHAQQALDTVNNGGVAACAAGSDPGCVPLDIFQLGQITPAMISFIGANGYQQASQVERIGTGAVTVDLGRYGVKLPTANSGVAFALGTEYRSESLDYRPDSLVEAGNLGGFGGPRPPVAGDFQVHELFTELRLPIIEDAPGATLLQADGAYRHAKYSSAGSANSYKGGLQYAPVHDATLRASYQRAVRAPSITELFSPAALGLYGGGDPCSGAELNAAGAAAPTEAQCANSGVTHDQYVNKSISDCLSGQCNEFAGGNPALKVETSTTRSYGITFTPTFLKGLTATLDYFDIDVRNAIGIVPPNQILTQCIQTGNPLYCDDVNRGPGGKLWGDPSIPGVGFISAINANLASLGTKGFDGEVEYKFGVGDFGRLGIRYNATYLIHLTSENGPGLGVYDCAGLYGPICGTPNPHYRHKLRTTWDLPVGVALSLDWRYFGDAHLDNNNADPNLTDGDGKTDVIDDHLKAKNYLDFAAVYDVPQQWTNIVKTQLRFGVSNLTNTKPQVVSSNNPNPVSAPPFGNGNTFPNVYDVLGPTFFLGLQADF
jgi:outer membrane receptor protein involved in Fe transport